MSSLMNSRKFWLAVFAMVQTIVFSLIPNFPAEIWASIDAVVLMLIWAIAKEDAAEKSRPLTYNLTIEDPEAMASFMSGEMEAGLHD